MKRLFALMFCLLIVTSAVTIAQEEAADDDARRYKVRQAQVHYQSVRQEVGMDTTIAYIQDELGVDTTALETIKADYSALADTIETFTSIAGFKEGRDQLKDKVKEFRELSTTLVEENGGTVDELRSRVAQAIADSADVDAAREALGSVASEFMLDKYDKHLERLQARYDRLAAQYPEKGDELVALKLVLDDFAEMRDDVEAAAASGDRGQMKSVNKQLRTLNQAFNAAAKDVLGALSGSVENKVKIIRGAMVLRQMSATITDLGALGLDVTTLQSLFDTAQADYDTAKAALEAGDSDELVKGYVDIFKADVKAFRDEVHVLVGEDNVNSRLIDAAAESLENGGEA